MKTDLYAKMVLTIIAICLVWICISMTSSAFADRDTIDVNIVKVSDKFIGNAVGQTRDTIIAQAANPILEKLCFRVINSSQLIRN